MVQPNIMSAATNTPGISLKELGSMDKAKEKINEYYEYCRGIFFIGIPEKLENAEIFRFFDIKEDNTNLDIFNYKRFKFNLIQQETLHKLSPCLSEHRNQCSGQVCGKINFARLFPAQSENNLAIFCSSRIFKSKKQRIFDFPSAGKYFIS